VLVSLALQVVLICWLVQKGCLIEVGYLEVGKGTKVSKRRQEKLGLWLTGS
jgi:hypothetical protein